MFGFLEDTIRELKGQMGCVTSKVPDIVGEGYRLKVKKTVAVGGSAKIMEVTSGKKTMVVKKIVAFTKREEERVSLEADLYRKLEKNPFVIDMLAHIVSDVTHYFLFDRFDMNFSEYLEKLKEEEKVVDEVQHLKYFCGIVSAIEELNGYGYAHLDIKPANILKTNDVVKLIDFGSATKMPLEIATSADHHRYREDAEERCSMMYRAPELFNCEIGATLTTAVDVWALGVCLYEFFFLENPFNKVYEQGGSIALATQSPQMIKWEGAVSEKVSDLIKRVLVVDPDNRPTAGDLRMKVEEMIENWNKDGAKEEKEEEEEKEEGGAPREITDEEFDRAMEELPTTR